MRSPGATQRGIALSVISGVMCDGDDKCAFLFGELPEELFLPVELYLFIPGQGRSEDSPSGPFGSIVNAPGLDLFGWATPRDRVFWWGFWDYSELARRRKPWRPAGDEALAEHAVWDHRGGIERHKPEQVQVLLRMSQGPGGFQRDMGYQHTRRS